LNRELSSASEELSPPQAGNNGRRIVVLTAVISVVTGLASFILFLAASYGSLPGDPSLFRQRIAEGFQGRHLVVNPYQEGSTTIGSHQWNDCLIIFMAVDQRGDRDRLALAPLLTRFDGPLSVTTNPCGALGAFDKGAKPNSDLYHYDRYVPGAVVLLRYMLPRASISEVRGAYRKALTSFLLGALALALVGLARGRDPARFAVLAVSSVVVMRYFGLESFSQSLGHGPADAVIAAYLLALCAMAFGRGGIGLALVAAAVFGALTIIFELFTGGVPIGLAMVIGLTPLVVRPPTRPWIAATAAGAAFIAAGAVLYAVRMAVISAIGGAAISSDAVAEVIRLTIFSREGPHLGVAAHNLLRSVGVLTGGMGLLAGGTMIIALLCGAFGFMRLWTRDPSPLIREQALMLAISAAVTPLWCAVFTVLMVNHAWFTDRVLVWPIAAGFGLFVLALIRANDAQIGRTAALADA
jgi:hypothetical protein